MKPSFSSFGLHSPEGVGVETRQNDIKTIIKQLEDKSGLNYTHAKESLYLDPDLIDLTFLPPPITPDDVSIFLTMLPGLKFYILPFHLQ